MHNVIHLWHNWLMVCVLGQREPNDVHIGDCDRDHDMRRMATCSTACGGPPSAAPAVWRRLSLGQQQGVARRRALRGLQSRPRLPQSPGAP